MFIFSKAFSDVMRSPSLTIINLNLITKSDPKTEPTSPHSASEMHYRHVACTRNTHCI